MSSDVGMLRWHHRPVLLLLLIGDHLLSLRLDLLFLLLLHPLRLLHHVAEVGLLLVLLLQSHLLLVCLGCQQLPHRRMRSMSGSDGPEDHSPAVGPDSSAAVAAAALVASALSSGSGQSARLPVALLAYAAAAPCSPAHFLRSAHLVVVRVVAPDHYFPLLHPPVSVAERFRSLQRLPVQP